MSAGHPTATLAPQTGHARDLGSAYQKAVPHLAGALEVVSDRPSVEARAHDLQAKLTILGIRDVTQEGRLILGGTVAVTPGVRRGVTMNRQVDTATTPDLDTVPEFLSYTRAARPLAAGSAAAVRLAATRNAPRAVAGTPKATPAAQKPATVRGATAGRTLAMKPSSVLDADEAIIVAEDMQFQDGMELVIGSDVKYLTIIVQTLTVGSGVTVRWEPATPPARGTAKPVDNGAGFPPHASSAVSAYHSPAGSDGEPGRGGDEGYAGDEAPTLEIWSLALSALPTIDLPGGKGGTGQRGGDGGNGGNGAMGLQSHSMAWGCDRTVGFGGAGGDGGKGGKGGKGGPGGSGGDLRLYLTDANHEAILAAGVHENRAGGTGGDPGDPGDGGAKGIGGDSGDPTGLWCHPKPERAGADGKAGSRGEAGTAGNAGEAGVLTAIVITEDDFRAKWTSPQVRTVTPSEAKVGDTVTISGANFTTTSKVDFGTVPGHTTVLADTIIQARVPAIATGWVEVVVRVPGGESSNPGSVKVIPSIGKVTPNPAALGQTITVTGSGFSAGCHLLFRGMELPAEALAADGTSIDVVLPAPPAPFEDLGGTEPIAVRNPDGTATGTVNLVLRHVVSTGFDVTRNGYAFLNQPPLQGLADGFTFEDTYGAFEVQASYLLEPVLVGAWYLFYTHFFNQAVPPGYSSGFSTTSINEYWSGNTHLHTDFATLPEVERTLTVAMGHVLSTEMLSILGTQALAGVGRAETSLNEVEAAFRAQIGMRAEERRRSAPIMQLMPAGTLTTKGFITKLEHSHGLLPIRVEYPVAGETWEKRIVVYDNAGKLDQESLLIFTRDSNGLGFVLSPDQPGMNRDTVHGWTLSQASLEVNLLSDVTIPTDYVFLLSPAAVLVEDAAGRRVGVKGGDSWADLPGALPAIGAPGLYLLPLDQDLTISLTGTGTGTYTVGIVSGSLGRSVTLVDVPVTPSTTDVVKIGDSLRDVVVSSSDAAKEVTMHYGVAGVRQARAVKVANARVGSGSSLTLRASDDLSTFDLHGDGADQAVMVALTAANDKRQRSQAFEGVAIGGAQTKTFSVTDWASLGSTTLV